jgi:hypothetical protein
MIVCILKLLTETVRMVYSADVRLLTRGKKAGLTWQDPMQYDRHISI